MINTNARNEAIRLARYWVSKKPVYLDTETTGTGPNDSIIEIAVIDHEGSVLIDTLVQPVGIISSGASAVHGISDSMVKNAPQWETIWSQVETFLKGRVVGIYNADFDLRLMRQSHQMNWLRWSDHQEVEYFCVMKLYAQFYGQWNPRYGNYRWQSLDQARKQSSIPLPNSHRAKADALLTRALLEYMAEQS
jgi:DNA polymerase III epsilon subunit-like protein